MKLDLKEPLMLENLTGCIWALAKRNSFVFLWFSLQEVVYKEVVYKTVFKQH